MNTNNTKPFVCKSVIFDLDGTILDTLTDLTVSVNHALASQGLPLRSEKEIRSFLGNGMQSLLTKSVPAGTSEEVFDKVFSVFTPYYKEHYADFTKPYEGIVELIHQLRGAGFKTAVVSNKADYAVQALILDIFPDMFDFVTGERAGIARKPAPDTVNACLEAFSLQASDAVYVGDSEVDIATALNAGMPCILVDWGFRDRQQLLDAGAEIIVSGAGEIFDLVTGGLHG